MQSSVATAPVELDWGQVIAVHVPESGHMTEAIRLLANIIPMNAKKAVLSFFIRHS